MSNLPAVDRALSVLGDEPRFAALVEAARGLAAAVDADPQNASLWREYRGALRDVLEASDGGSDEFADLFARLAAGGDSPPA